MNNSEEELLSTFLQSDRVLDLRDNPLASEFTYEKQTQALDDLTEKLKASKVIETTLYTTKTQGYKLVSDLLVSIGIAYIVNAMYLAYAGLKSANILPLNYILGAASEVAEGRSTPQLNLIGVVERMLPSLVNTLRSGKRSEQELYQRLFKELTKLSKLYIETLPPDRKKAINELDKLIASRLESFSSEGPGDFNSVKGLLTHRTRLLCIPSRRLDLGHLKKYGNPDTRAKLKTYFKEDVIDKYPSKMEGQLKQIPKKMGFSSTNNEPSRPQYVMVGAPGTGKSLLPRLVQKAYLRADISVPLVYIDLKELVQKQSDQGFGGQSPFHTFMHKFAEEYSKAKYKNAIFVIEEGAQLLTKKNKHLDQMKDFLDLEKKEITVKGHPGHPLYVIKDFDSATLYFTGNEKLKDIDPAMLDHRLVGMEMGSLEREKREPVLEEVQANQLAEVGEYDITPEAVAKIKEVVKECNKYLLDIDEKAYEGVRVLKRAGRELIQNLLQDAIDDEDKITIENAKGYVDVLYARAIKEGWEADKAQDTEQRGFGNPFWSNDSSSSVSGDEPMHSMVQPMQPMALNTPLTQKTETNAVPAGTRIVMAASSKGDDTEIQGRIREIVKDSPIVDLDISLIHSNRQKMVLDALTTSDSCCTNLTLTARGLRDKDGNLKKDGVQVADILSFLRAIDEKDPLSITLDLSDREIGDDVAADLASLRKLTTLFANQNNLTKTGAEALIASPALQIIQVDSNRISPTEAAELEQSSPKILAIFSNRRFDVEMHIGEASGIAVVNDEIATSEEDKRTSPSVDAEIVAHREEHPLIALGVCAESSDEPSVAKTSGSSSRVGKLAIGISFGGKSSNYTSVEITNFNNKYSYIPAEAEPKVRGSLGTLIGVRPETGDLLCEVPVTASKTLGAKRKAVQIVPRDAYHGPQLTNEHIDKLLDAANFGKIGIKPVESLEQRSSMDTTRSVRTVGK